MAKSSKKTAAVASALALGLLCAAGAWHTSATASASELSSDTPLADQLEEIAPEVAALERSSASGGSSSSGGGSGMPEDAPREYAGIVYEVADAWSPTRDSKDADVAISISNNVRVSMDLTIRSIQDGWNNVFHVGASNGVRMPALWLYPSSPRLHFRVGTSRSTNDGLNSPELQLNVKYSVVFEAEVDNNEMRLLIDGKVVAEYQGRIAVRAYDDLPMYRSDPWYTAANVEVENFVLQSNMPLRLRKVFARKDAFTPVKSDNSGEKIDVQHAVRTSFDLTLRSFNNAWANILHVGNSNGERQPAFWIYPNAPRLHCRVRTSRSTNDGLNSGNLELNRKYNVVFDAFPDEITLYIDDVQVGQVATALEITPALDQTVWLSDPWYNAADVSIENLVIKTVDGKSTRAKVQQRAQAAVSVSGAWSPVKNTKDEQTLSVKNSVRVAFNLEIKGAVSGWANVFHFGAENSVRSPALWLNPGGTKLVPVIATSANNNHHFYGTSLALNTEYSVVIVGYEDRLALFIDGELNAETTGTFTITERADLPFYRSDPWYNAANVVVSNFKVDVDYLEDDE